MRLYLEATEKVEMRQTPEFIRADVTGKTASEITSIQADMEDIMAGKSYQVYRHECRHDGGAPCQRELVKEVLI